MERITVSFARSSSDEGKTLTGTAHTYGTVTHRDGQAISFAPGAFSKALRNPNTDVVALWNHNSDMPLARQSNNSLSLEDHEDGLHFTMTLPDTTYANDLLKNIESGIVNGMSFSVDPGKATVSKLSDGTALKTYSEVRDLIDISPVSLPAFAGTVLNRFAQTFDNESIESQTARARDRVRREYDDN